MDQPSWFASAYDTDDWVYRLMTMLQMVGHHVDNRVMVAGYIVMRIALGGSGYVPQAKILGIRSSVRRSGRRRPHVRHVVVVFRGATCELLHAHRERSFRFGYLPIVMYGAIVATGAGLHAAAYYIEHHSKLSAAETVSAVALPFGLYIMSIYALYR